MKRDTAGRAKKLVKSNKSKKYIFREIAFLAVFIVQKLIFLAIYEIAKNGI